MKKIISIAVIVLILAAFITLRPKPLYTITVERSETDVTVINIYPDDNSDTASAKIINYFKDHLVDGDIYIDDQYPRLKFYFGLKGEFDVPVHSGSVSAMATAICKKECYFGNIQQEDHSWCNLVLLEDGKHKDSLGEFGSWKLAVQHAVEGFHENVCHQIDAGL